MGLSPDEIDLIHRAGADTFLEVVRREVGERAVIFVEDPVLAGLVSGATGRWTSNGLLRDVLSYGAPAALEECEYAITIPPGRRLLRVRDPVPGFACVYRNVFGALWRNERPLGLGGTGEAMGVGARASAPEPGGRASPLDGEGEGSPPEGAGHGKAAGPERRGTRTPGTGQGRPAEAEARAGLAQGRRAQGSGTETRPGREPDGSPPAETERASPAERGRSGRPGEREREVPAPVVPTSLMAVLAVAVLAVAGADVAGREALRRSRLVPVAAFLIAAVCLSPLGARAIAELRRPWRPPPDAAVPHVPPVLPPGLWTSEESG